MNYFPMFLDLKDRPVLICGGGNHALEKAERLLPFQPRIHVVSPKICPGIKELPGITWEERPFRASDLKAHPVFVVAAEEERRCREIVQCCRERHIPVNAVDLPQLCDFYFPVLLTTRELCIGISTGGRSPTAGLHLRRRIREQIPDSIDELLPWLWELREELSRIMEKPARNQALREIVEKAFAEDRLLTAEEVRQIQARAADGTRQRS